jgi:glutamyl-tRNA reductase
MPLLVLGVSHRTASVAQRERAVLAEPAARAVLRDLRANPAVMESTVLSTCNRTELFAVGPDPERAQEALVEALVRHAGVARRELEPLRYVRRDEDAVRHLFRVAASLDSMVVGESEILGQVRAAHALAIRELAAGPALRLLFGHAHRAGRRVRVETGIGRGPTSLPSVAVDVARRAFEDLSGRSVLLIGAGHVAQATARALLRHGVCAPVVANRTETEAQSLALALRGRGVGLDALGAELAGADIVISCTDAPHAIIGRDAAAQALAARDGRGIVLIDLAVPRDLDPELATLEGVTLHDMDDLQRIAGANRGARRREIGRAEALVAREVERFLARRRNGRGVAAHPRAERDHGRLPAAHAALADAPVSALQRAARR